MGEIEVHTYSLRDTRYFRVYCRYCGRQSAWWDKVRHPKWCVFAEAFLAEYERLRRPVDAGAGFGANDG